MHPQLADWYRGANIEPDANALPKRWVAVSEFDPGRDQIAEAARLFYGFEPRDSKFLESFRAALQEADPTVKMSGNDQEIAVLAGAFLADAVERCEAPLCYFAALATVCPAAKNLRGAPVVPAIPELATVALSKWSADRFADKPSAPAAELLSAKGSDEIKKFFEASDLAGLSAPVAKMHSAVRKLQGQIKDMHRQLSLQIEETNILWWLLGEHSRDTKKPFSSHTPGAASLIAGKELADLVRELPGPSSAMAFLDRTIRAHRKKFPDLVSITSAVNDVPAEWRQIALGQYDVESLSHLTPIFAALKAASSVPENESWSPIYRHAERIDPDAQIAPNNLTDQIYLEGLLVHSWSAADAK